MIGLDGYELTREEQDLLRHPLVGGVILFTRNFQTPAQLVELNRRIHALRRPRLLVGVDHEGGRVQRFRDGFTRLPAVRPLGEVYDQDPRKALWLARVSGWLMAIELRSAGVDLSFAPVLDLDRGVSGVIGDRAFHSDPEAVADLARAYMIGMRRAGMEATGKHFPGHGSVAADSHSELPVDPRSLTELMAGDLIPFERLSHYGIAALMMAHVVYPEVDTRPAGYSRTWIRDILRRRLGFQGLVFSDDLDMAGALWAGEPDERARLALEAGCDMVLACNDRGAAVRILDRLGRWDDPVSHLRLVRMHGRNKPTRVRLGRSRHWRKAVDAVQRYDENPLLDMDL
jgi:beta-N-acetylhexosaminidase